MRRVALRRIVSLPAIAVLVVGSAIGLCMVGQATGCTTPGDGAEELKTPTAAPSDLAAASPTATPRPIIVRTLPPPTVSPTPSPNAIPTVMPTLVPPPTPGAGVCPTPIRITLEDFPPDALPPVRPASELPGIIVEGGGPFEVVDVTLHLPAGRDFVVLGPPPYADEQVISIYDIETASQLIVRGDGCEISRFVRDPEADAVFDQIVAALKAEAG